MKAIIIGATGLIGKNLLQILEKDNYFGEIEVWVRKPIQSTSSKTKVKIINFRQFPEVYDAQFVFCCIGTTIKKAGSKEEFRKIDYDIPVKIAKLCEHIGVEKLLVISSISANQNSSNNYLKTKGEMENTIFKSKIPSIWILRPSILMGKRDEFRLGELIGKFFIQGIGLLLIGKLKKYRGIQAVTVARAMLNIVKGNSIGKHILESDEIKQIAVGLG